MVSLGVDGSTYFFQMMENVNISLRIVHIPGHLNVIADMLSRGYVLITEWSLNQRVFDATMLQSWEPYRWTTLPPDISDYSSCLQS